METLDFEKLFKLQMVGMKVNRCHPDTKVDKYWVLQNLITLGVYTMFFLLLLYSIKYDILRNDYFSAFKNSVPVTYYICMMLYYYLLIINRPTLGKLIKSVKNDYAKACKMDIRRKTLILENAAKGIKIMNFWCFLMIFTIISFLLKNAILTIYYLKTSGEFKFIPYYEMYYPFNITERREHNVYIFAVTFVGESHFTTMCGLIYFCTVPLGPVFILHACGQMELIKIKFENIFDKNDVDKELNEIVKSLQYVYSFVKEINECFTFIYEIMLKQNTLLLPFTSYAMIQSISHGEFTVEYIGVILQSFFTTSLPCYYGDLLMQKGEEVRLAAYNSGWERVYKPSARKTLLIILTRALRPVAINSIFCIICLDTLTNIYRQAYTIFNLMTAMW